MFLLLYINDMLLRPCLKFNKPDQKCLNENYDMKEFGDARRILDMDIIRDMKKSSLVLT